MTADSDGPPLAPAGRGEGRPGTRLLLVLAVVLALAGFGGIALAMTGSPGPARLAPPPEAPSAPVAGVVLPPSDPVALDIPAIGVHTPLLTLGLNPDGTVEVPPLAAGANSAGWYDGSPTPGELGPAVILGHVDSARFGPAVFHDLEALLPGDRATVTRADGSVVTFQVDSVATYPKRSFPAGVVYGDINHAGLRLITCGGAFDRAAGSYEDNVVVYASAVPAGRAG